MRRSLVLSVLLMLGLGGCAASADDLEALAPEPVTTAASESAPTACSPAVPFKLISKDATALQPAITSAHASCPRTGGSWCTVDAGVAFTYPRCLTTTPTVAEMSAAALAATDPRGIFDPRFGRTLTRSELGAEQAFKHGLLLAADWFARSTDVRAMLYESEEPCHNCHQFSAKYVLVYLRTRTIVVVDGTYGYDS